MAKDNKVDEMLDGLYDFLVQLDRVWIGIDPGNEGAIAFIDDKQSCFVVDIPTLKQKRSNGRNTTVFDHHAICEIFKVFRGVRKWRTDGAMSFTVSCMLEHALPQAGPTARGGTFTAFSVGVGYGIWPLFLAQLQIPCSEVYPIVWKKAMGLLKQSKDVSRARARTLFPHADLSRKGDHNRAEAILLALYGRTKEIGGFTLPAQERKKQVRRPAPGAKKPATRKKA